MDTLFIIKVVSTAKGDSIGRTHRKEILSVERVSIS